ncbi:O-antigen ligase family protein [Aerococcus urinaehominis]|nr:O-antigen ligase family protein [Aerococcus urinaehominis]
MSTLVIGLVLYIFSFFKKTYLRENITYILILSGLLFLGAFNYITNDNTNLYGFIVSLISYGGVALSTLNYRLFPKLFKYLFWIPALFFVYHILIGGNANYVLLQSQNYVTIVLFLFLGYIYISDFQNNNMNLNLLELSVSLIIALWAQGRSGIISLVLLFVLTYITVLQKSSKIKMTRKFGYSLFLIICLVGVIVFALPHRERLLSRFYLVSISQTSHRLIMWIDYLKKISQSAKFFIFGAGENQFLGLISLYGHVHNSFLNIHSKFGLIGFVLILIMFYKAITFLYRNYRLLFVYFVCLLFRAFTDDIFPIYLGDFFLYYLIGLSIFKSKYLVLVSSQKAKVKIDET